MGVVCGVVVHGTRSGVANNPTEGTGTVNYCTTPGTTSYNFVIDWDGTVYELVPPGTAAWHAQELNHNWIGIGLAQGVESDPITEGQHQSLSWLIHRMAADYEIPLKRLSRLDGPRAARGIVEHHHTAQGKRVGKSDIGRRLDWARLGVS